MLAKYFKLCIVLKITDYTYNNIGSPQNYKYIVFLEFNFKLIIYNSEHILQWE